MEKFVKIFNSVADLCRLRSEVGSVYDEGDDSTRIYAESRTEWRGNINFIEAFDRLENGDSESAARIKNLNLAVRTPIQERVRLENSVVGCVPNCPAHIMGLPKQMINVRRRPIHVPVVSIFIDTAVSAFVDAADMEKAAAHVASCVAAIERKGVRVNLYAGFAAEGKITNGPKAGKKGQYLIAAKIKSATAPLNLLTAAFPMASVAFLRTVLFHAYEVIMPWNVHAKGCPMDSQPLIPGNIKAVSISIQTIIRQKMSETDIENYIKQKAGI